MIAAHAFATSRTYTWPWPSGTSTATAMSADTCRKVTTGIHSISGDTS